MRILLAYASLSGNTRDVARRVHAQCEAAGHAVTWIHTDLQTLQGALGDAGRAADFDLHLLGSWSDNAGRTPAEMKRYIAELVEAAGKAIEVAAFGTGETQWGLEYYCGAVKRIARFFDSAYPRLEIEQMPHGDRDNAAIDAWCAQVLALCAARARQSDAAHTLPVSQEVVGTAATDGVQAAAPLPAGSG
ncbi:flavodoxin [Xanthomonas sp. A2111]|uniref:Flavodoxin n=1 Tax=Xanthomonas hawaiiensis TaxID=3003247 RepID=A0ABU2I4A0_9XANT|nr:flavodoxin [Xanthomonas sp. A2111]MBO9827026.1 flavodoxin [Xanthomonas sp. A2111]MDS9992966.1 flavodoxin [Xanthomonas sp. A2111]